MGRFVTLLAAGALALCLAVPAAPTVADMRDDGFAAPGAGEDDAANAAAGPLLPPPPPPLLRGAAGPDPTQPWSMYDRLAGVSQPGGFQGAGAGGDGDGTTGGGGGGVNGTLGEALRDVLQYEFRLSRPQLQRSLTYLGPHHRLRRLVARMSRGSGGANGGPFRVGVVGGSISFGHGASEPGATDWFSLVARWLPRAFPRARFEAHNGCVPATPAAFMALCLEDYLDRRADLVFVEYVINDGLEDRLLHNRRVRIYERLLRRILGQPNAPAVVLMQVGAHGMFHPRDYISPNGVHEWRPFHHTLEDLYGAVAQYYATPTLSFRGAVYNVGREQGHDFRRFVRDDFIHPNDLGHRILADMVVHLFQEAAVGLALWPLAREDETDALGRLPEPMYPGNNPSSHRACFHDEGLRAAVPPGGAAGWEWVNEGSEASPKWGFVSRVPGAVLKVQLDTSLAALDPGAELKLRPEVVGNDAVANAKQHTAVVIFSYLKSYEQMGRAAFRCESGCACRPRHADGTNELTESTVYFVQLHATPGRNCTVSVINTSGPDDRGTKFKVTGVMVTLANEATLDLAMDDFAEDWPQYGIAGAARVAQDPTAAAAAPGAGTADAPQAGSPSARLRTRGRLHGHGRGHRHSPAGAAPAPRAGAAAAAAAGGSPFGQPAAAPAAATAGVD